MNREVRSVLIWAGVEEADREPSMDGDSTKQPRSRAALNPMNVPIVERAFQLARSGEFARLREIGSRLQGEGYLDVQEHLQDSRLLRQQLRSVVRRAVNRTGHDDHA